MNEFHLETPQERRARRHEEDKIINPDRHDPQKIAYSFMEAQSLCYWCAPNFSEKYVYNAQSNEYVRNKNVEI